jgi:hypothetical protein
MPSNRVIVTMRARLRGMGLEAECLLMATEVSLPNSGLPPEYALNVTRQGRLSERVRTPAKVVLVRRAASGWHEKELSRPHANHDDASQG